MSFSNGLHSLLHGIVCFAIGYFCSNLAFPGADVTITNQGTYRVYQPNTRNGSQSKVARNRSRVACLVTSSNLTASTNAKAVYDTWGQSCDKLLFLGDQGTMSSTRSLPFLHLDVLPGYDNLPTKVLRGFDHVIQHMANDFDWFLKADDDTYVIMNNLRHMVSEYNLTTPLCIGHVLKENNKDDPPVYYLSGGAGYVCNRLALHKLHARSRDDCAIKDGVHGYEDVSMARCLVRVGVRLLDARDAQGRTRMHPFVLFTHLHGNKQYPDWYRERDIYRGTRYGLSSISPRAATFHYVSAPFIKDYHTLLDHIHTY